MILSLMFLAVSISDTLRKPYGKGLAFGAVMGPSSLLSFSLTNTIQMLHVERSKFQKTLGNEFIHTDI